MPLPRSFRPCADLKRFSIGPKFVCRRGARAEFIAVENRIWNGKEFNFGIDEYLNNTVYDSISNTVSTHILGKFQHTHISGTVDRKKVCRNSFSQF